jgi:hypothetical protein
MLRLRSTLRLALAAVLVAPTALAQPRPLVPQPAPAAPAPPTIRSQLSGDARDAWDRAQQLLRAKNFEGGLVEFTRAFDLSKNPRVLFNVGICEKGLSHYARASMRFEQELREGEATLSEDEKKELREAIAIVRKYVSTVSVTSSEQGAHLLVDGFDVGTTPFKEPVTVDVGHRELTLKKDGFASQTKGIDVNAGVPVALDFHLDATNKTGSVTIAISGAPNATISMDGTDMGPAPFKGNVPAGRHTFEAKQFGYTTASQTVDVSYQGIISVTLAMSTERHEARVTIDANPPGAAIEIDGTIVGSSHWEGTLKTGGHQLVVRKPGYDPFSQEIALQDDQVRTVQATLLESARKDWIWWTVGTLAVVGAGTVASFFVFKAADSTPFVGSLQPGIAKANVRF